MSDESRIKVCVRLRPISEGGRYWRTEENRLMEANDRSWMFDHVFDEKVGTKYVYAQTMSQLVPNAVKGIHGTALVYGQTSSGKTYTMFGDENVQKSPGAVQMALQDLFREVTMLEKTRSFEILMSYLEVYNEVVWDLLDETAHDENSSGLGNGVGNGNSNNNTACGTPTTKVLIRENPKGGVTLSSKRVRVKTYEDALRVLEQGQEKRRVSSTGMNERSSRAHTILTVHVVSTAKTDKSKLYAQLNFVDLAGSESMKTSHASGNQITEAKNINQSLLSLALVISKLAQSGGGSGGTHISFRSSKLTRILKPALCGESLVSIVCCITPASKFLEESRSTLQFARTARKIPVHAKVNKIVDPEVMIAKLKREVEELRQQCATPPAKGMTRSGSGSSVEKLKQEHELQIKKIERLKRLVLLGGNIPNSPSQGKINRDILDEIEDLDDLQEYDDWDYEDLLQKTPILSRSRRKRMFYSPPGSSGVTKSRPSNLKNSVDVDSFWAQNPNHDSDGSGAGVDFEAAASSSMDSTRNEDGGSFKANLISMQAQHFKQKWEESQAELENERRRSSKLENLVQSEQDQIGQLLERLDQLKEQYDLQIKEMHHGAQELIAQEKEKMDLVLEQLDAFKEYYEGNLQEVLQTVSCCSSSSTDVGLFKNELEEVKQSHETQLEALYRELDRVREKNKDLNLENDRLNKENEELYDDIEDLSRDSRIMPPPSNKELDDGAMVLKEQLKKLQIESDEARVQHQEEVKRLLRESVKLQEDLNAAKRSEETSCAEIYQGQLEQLELLNDLIGTYSENGAKDEIRCPNPQQANRFIMAKIGKLKARMESLCQQNQAFACATSKDETLALELAETHDQVESLEKTLQETRQVHKHTEASMQTRITELEQELLTKTKESEVLIDKMETIETSLQDRITLLENDVATKTAEIETLMEKLQETSSKSQVSQALVQEKDIALSRNQVLIEDLEDCLSTQGSEFEEKLKQISSELLEARQLTQEKDDMITSLKTEIETMSSRTEEIQILSTQKVELDEEMKKMNAELFTAQNLAQEKQELLNALQIDHEKLQGKLRDTTAIHEDLVTQIQELRENKELLQEEYQKLHSEKEEMELCLQTMQTEFQQSQETLADTRSDLEISTRANEELATKNEELKQEVAQYLLELEKLRNDSNLTEEMHAEMESMLEEINDLEANNAALLSNLESYDAEVVELRECRAKANAEIEVLQNKLEDLHEEIEEAEMVKQELRLQHDRALKELEEKHQIEIAEMMKTHQQNIDHHKLEERAALEKSHQRKLDQVVAQKNVELQTMKNELKQVQSVFETVIQDKQGEVEDIEEKLQAKEAVIKTMKSSIDQLNRELDAKVEVVKTLKISLESEKNKQETLNEGFKELQSNLQSKVAMLNTLHNEKLDVQRKMENLQDQLGDHRLSNSQMIEKLQTQATKIGTLENQLSLLEAKNQTASEQLGELQRIKGMYDEIIMTRKNMESIGVNTEVKTFTEQDVQTSPPPLMRDCSANTSTPTLVEVGCQFTDDWELKFKTCAFHAALEAEVRNSTLLTEFEDTIRPDSPFSVQSFQSTFTNVPPHHQRSSLTPLQTSFHSAMDNQSMCSTPNSNFLSPFHSPMMRNNGGPPGSKRWTNSITPFTDSPLSRHKKSYFPQQDAVGNHHGTGATPFRTPIQSLLKRHSSKKSIV